jgi:hypothetical protein
MLILVVRLVHESQTPGYDPSLGLQNISSSWIQQVKERIKFRRNTTVVSECYSERSLPYCVGEQLKHLRIIDWPSTGSVSV